jgi:hypothetical protein
MAAEHSHGLSDVLSDLLKGRLPLKIWQPRRSIDYGM